jgi:hypothetical protein
MNYEDVKQQIPDMSASVFANLTDQGATIQDMKNLFSPDPEIQRARNQKINELMHNFDGLDRSVIENVLIQNDWNEINAIIPLFGLYEEHQRKQQENKQVQELTRKRLELINDEFTEEDFKQKLDENDGDREATITQLLEIVEQRQIQKRKDQELVNRQYENEKAIATLQQRFADINKDEIVTILKKNNWDLVSAGKEILKISEQKKITLLEKLYPLSSKLEIEEALEAANWEFGQACNILIQKKPQTIPKPANPLTRNKLEESLKIRGDKLIQQIQADRDSRPTYETLADSQVRRALDEKFRKPAFQPGQQEVQPEFKVPVVTAPAPAPAQPVVEPIHVQPLPPPPSSQPLPSKSESNQDANTGTVTLSLEQTVVDINNEITIRWKINDNHDPSNDWIAFYDATEDNLQKYQSYQWVASSEKQGFLKFIAPQQYGKYRFLYLKNKSYRILAESQVVSVGPVYEISAVLQENNVTDVRNVVVSFKKLSGNEHHNAWVGMYKAGSSTTQIQEYQWLSNAVNSTLKFAVPKKGVWDFKLFPERSLMGPYVSVAQCSITIPGIDTLTLTHNGAQSTIEYDIQTLDPATDRVWIGVFFADSTSSSDYRRSKNITTSKGKYTIKTPIHGGTYHARLYGNGSTEHCATSNSITVPDTSK